ncbi:MAG TPA: CHAT domain-containing protein [Thermoanaerobaculia bacterium]|nr:CHAT domain-containing protein [Thermoanaerobaculia bacterium]
MRTAVEDEWLGQWGDAVDRGDDAAARHVLDALQAASLALAETTRDTLTQDSVRALVEATELAAKGNRTRLLLLAHGHRLYRDARVLQEAENYSPSRALLKEAIRLFVEAGSPFASWARYREAVAVYHAPDNRKALALLEPLGALATGRDRRVLAGHVAWMVGLTRERLGEWTSALASFELAEGAFASSQEVENRAAIRALRIWALHAMGRDDDAEHEMAAVLDDLPWIVKPRRLFNVLNDAVDTLQRSGEESTALYFQDEALRLAKDERNPNWIARGYWQHADLLQRLGLDGAEEDLRQAHLHALDIPDPEEQLNVEVAVLQVQARLAAAVEPQRALGLLNRAMEKAKAMQFLLIDLFSDRAAVRLQARDFAAGASDIEGGLAELDRQLHEAATDKDRNALREQGRRLFEMLVRLEVEKGGTPSAGRLAAERLRVRGLADPLETVEASSIDLLPSAVPSTTPTGTAILEYLALPDRLYSWLVLPDRVLFHEEPLPAATLAAAVGDYVRTLREEEPTAAEANAEHLRALLLATVAPHLAGISALVIVPDRALWSLPFAALTLADHSYLAEHYTITIAASSSRYAARADAGRTAAAARAASVLVVGGEGASGGDGELLPGVAKELQDIESIYPGALVLRGAAATPEAVLRELPRHALFHFAGHAREAPAGLDLYGATLGATDLPRGPLERPLLAVLAGCRSAAGTVSGARGAQSLARAFLSRGVPDVVASLWDVEDSAAAKFSVAFHAALRRGEAPAAALRSAQQQFLSSTDPALRRPAAWSTYQLLAGGVAGDVSGR